MELKYYKLDKKDGTHFMDVSITELSVWYLAGCTACEVSLDHWFKPIRPETFEFGKASKEHS